MNPYQSPAESPEDDAKPRRRRWHSITFAFLGFAIGTAVASQFVLSREPLARFFGGAIYGGTLGAIAGLTHGLRRRRISVSAQGEEGIESE